ncbi:MAG: NUDIX domain-containing protein [Bacteriovoracaceae bacterium]
MTIKTRKAQVVIATIDSNRQFYFLLLQTNKKRGEFWQNITGKVEEGETIEEGALREAIEETGMQIESIVDIIDLGMSYQFNDQHGRKVDEKCFLIILDGKWDIKLDPHEHQNYQWITLDNLSEGSVKYTSNFETLKKAQHILKHWGQ